MSSEKKLARLIGTAAILGGVGVAAGAFGAHALKAHLHALGGADTWDTAVLYQLLHALAALAASLAAMTAPAALARALSRATRCWLIGTLLFSGSLYGLALGGPRWLGPITPVGGLFYLAGWTAIAIATLRRNAVKE